MKSPQFVDHYRILISSIGTSGLPTPWVQKPESFCGKFSKIFWDICLISVIVYMLFCYMFTVMTITISIQDLSRVGISTASSLYGLLLTVWHFWYSKHLKSITDNMDRISCTIERTDPKLRDTYRNMYTDNADFVRKLTLFAFRYSALLPFVYHVAVPITDYLSGHYRTRFPFRINNPFDQSLPGLYEAVMIIMTCCVTSSYWKKTATDCLFVTLFTIHTDFLKYLSLSLASLKNELIEGDPYKARRKLILWIKLHQSVMMNVQELVLVFSPVIIIYYMCMLGNIVCAAFILIKNDEDSFFQSALMSVYVTVALFYQFLLSNAAAQLASEAQEIANYAYDTLWYDVPKSTSNMVRLIITRANKPIEVTAYKTNIFLLNRETYAGFVTTVLSAFVTLCQMKDLFDE